VLTGVYPATSGNIELNAKPIHSLSEHQRVARGLARTFQTATSFPDFTVREQVTLASNVTLKTHPVSSVFGGRKQSAEAQETSLHVQHLLELTGLDAVAEDQVSTISSGQQRFLMIATALAAKPTVLLLDEPAAGLIAQERETLASLIKSVRDDGTAVLVIEHHMGLIMDVSDRIVVLNFGSMIADGTPTEIRQNQTVIDAYLGEVG